MNWYFYRLWIYIQVLTAGCIFFTIVGKIEVSWSLMFAIWFLIGPVGIGVGFHRLLSHRSFETHKWIEYALTILGSLALYAPPLFWCAQHQYHHKVSDTPEDPSSPTQYGFIESFLMYRMRKSVLKKINIRNYCVRLLLKDKFIMWVSRDYLLLACVWLAFLCLFPNILAAYLFAVALEHTRTNVVSSLSHMPICGSYRNHSTQDSSQNNFILGYLSMGFAWHNNHHANPRKLNLHERWWELDVEGLIGKMLEKKK